VAGNSDGFVHALMLKIEKEKTKNNPNKAGLFDLGHLQFGSSSYNRNSNSQFSNAYESGPNSMDDLQFGGADTLSPK
jgi:hypothetical protein